MDTILEAIFQRKSTRSYTDKQIEDSKRDLILEAGTYAPSGMNSQCWQFTAVQNQGILKALNENVIKTFQSIKITKDTNMGLMEDIKMAEAPDYNFYFNAPTLVIVSAPEDYENRMADCSLALENMFLQSAALNIGSCWVSQLSTLCNEHYVRKILDEIEIPKNHIVIGATPLGYEKATEIEEEPVHRNQNVIHIIA